MELTNIESINLYMEGKTVAGVSVKNDAYTGRDTLEEPANRIILTLRDQAGNFSQVNLIAGILEMEDPEHDLPELTATYDEGLLEI